MNLEEKVKTLISNEDYVSIDVAGIHEDLVLNDVVYVAGTQVVHEDKDDLYNLRLKLLVQLTAGDMTLDRGGQIYLVDPCSFTKVCEEQQARYEEINNVEEEEPEQLELV